MSKILIDARMYGLEHAGIGRYILNLIDELTVIAKEDMFVILLRKKYFDELKLPNNWEKIKADFRHYSLTEQIKLPSIIYSQKADIVHFPHFNIPVFWGGKFIVTIHDMTMHSQGINSTTLPLPIYLLKRIPYRFVFSRAVSRSKTIITPSESVKKQIAKYFSIDAKKILVTYEGYKSDFIADKEQSRELDILSKFKIVNDDYFFYVGNAYPHKNLGRVIAAVMDLNKNKNVRAKFVIAGSRNEFTNRLEKQIEELNAQNFVKLLGFVSDEELRVLYKYSLGFVYPSLSEGFGLQGLEAIASGTIVIASNIPIFREIYQSHAFYFDPLSVASISSTLFSVLGMKQADKYKYQGSAREFIKKYSWRKMAEETLDVYHKAL